MKPEFFERDASVAEVKAYIDEWGFAVIAGAADAETMDGVARDMNRYAKGMRPLEMEFFGGALIKIPEMLVGIDAHHSGTGACAWMRSCALRSRHSAAGVTASISATLPSTSSGLTAPGMTLTMSGCAATNCSAA